ncbi:MAG: hypothetical protein ACI8W7_003717 [Gammaproteobacteria bacterium]|jgi:hypothetical protein
MHHLLRQAITPAMLAITLLSHTTAQATNQATSTLTQQATRSVDLVLALDVSNSMSGLIDSAKQRLWDVVNEFNQAQPQPDLRVAVISYGNPRYGKGGGYVRIDQALTRDLDAVNQALFGFKTNGGDEYVARVITRASNELQWSAQRSALRVLFIAGNESATQDPQLDLRQAINVAREKDIIVNTIFCGKDGHGGVPASWRSVAQHAGGVYASIDQQQSAVANVAAPQDKQLRELNAELNKTYVPFGRTGEQRHENQRRQDSNAATMSEQAVAARAVIKASKMYRSADWDLVDAVESGVKLKEVDAKTLPALMRDMNEQERTGYVQQKADQRKSLRAQIQQLGSARADHIATERARMAPSETTGFSAAMQQGLRAIAEKKGFTFEN